MFGLFKSEAQKKKEQDFKTFNNVGKAVAGMVTQIEEGSNNRELIDRTFEGALLLAGMANEQVNVYGMEPKKYVQVVKFAFDATAKLGMLFTNPDIKETALVNLSHIAMIPTEVPGGENFSKTMFEVMINLAPELTPETQEKEEVKEEYNGIGFKPSYMR